MKALQLAKPHILVMVGGPASGKTAFAEKFADTFHAPYIDAKAFRVGEISPTATLGLVYEVLTEIQKTKQTIVYEGMTGSRAERAQLVKLARKNGYEPLFIWVQTDPTVAHARATKRSRQNPTPMSDEVFDREQARFTAPSAQERAVVISGMHTYASQARAVLKRLVDSTSRTSGPAKDPSPSRSPRRPVIIR